MNLLRLKEILDNPILTENQQRTAIYEELSKDKNSITTILMILNAERERNDKLITDLNLYLSKANVVLQEPKLNKDGFVQKEIAEFYSSGRINECFPKQK